MFRMKLKYGKNMLDLNQRIISVANTSKESQRGLLLCPQKIRMG
jgi:hypothetical protein